MHGSYTIPKALAIMRDLLIVTAFCFGDLGTAEEQKWRQRLLDEAPSKWAQYVETIRNFGYRDDWYELDEDGNKMKKQEDLACTIETRTNHAERAKVHYWRIVGDAKNASLCRGYNSKYAFELLIDSRTDRWFLSKVLLADEKNYEPFIKRLEASLFGCVSLQVLDEYLPSWVSEKRLKLEKMEPTPGESGQLLKIWFSNVTGEPIPRFPEKGWFVVDTDKWWIVKEYDVVSAGIIYRERFEYKLEDGTIPLLKQRLLETVALGKDPNTKKRRTQREFTYQSRDSPITEITLSAFGIPEPHGISWGTRSNTWLWFAGAGIVFLGLLALAQRYLKKSVKPAS